MEQHLPLLSGQLPGRVSDHSVGVPIVFLLEQGLPQIRLGLGARSTSFRCLFHLHLWLRFLIGLRLALCWRLVRTAAPEDEDKKNAH
jgi:hypothetical protein